MNEKINDEVEEIKFGSTYYVNDAYLECSI